MTHQLTGHDKRTIDAIGPHVEPLSDKATGRPL